MKGKNLAIFFGVLVVLIVALVVLNNFKKDTVYGMPSSDLSQPTRDLLDDPNYNNILIPDKLDQMIADKNSFFVYYFSASCPHCLFSTPQIKPIADDLGINFHQFNLLEFQSYLGKMDINATPTLVYYKDGVEAGRMEGGLKESANTVGYTLDDFKKFFTDHKPDGND
ncbi:thioredoxin family protein [Cohnella yongneupensis]|uniref:Thioredoxin family protein n=1 Tax=Cohnella yongneupensis TaxID=425006 RepID=A0ABW0QWR4_9BACL